MTKKEFNDWYVSVLTDLYVKQAGFPILLISFPILERYLRQVSGVGESRLNDQFYVTLKDMFGSLINRNIAKQFWHIYRNGLLHQVTFSQRNQRDEELTPACITFDQEQPIQYKNKIFSVNPISFSERVIQCVSSDYEEMTGENSPNHPGPYIFTDRGANMTGTACDTSWMNK